MAGHQACVAKATEVGGTAAALRWCRLARPWWFLMQAPASAGSPVGYSLCDVAGDDVLALAVGQTGSELLGQCGELGLKGFGLLCVVALVCGVDSGEPRGDRPGNVGALGAAFATAPCRAFP